MKKPPKPLTIQAKKPSKNPIGRIKIDLKKLIIGLSKTAVKGAAALSGDAKATPEALLSAAEIINAFSANDPLETRLWNLLSRSLATALTITTNDIIEVTGGNQKEINNALSKLSSNLSDTEILIDETIWQNPRGVSFYANLSSAYFTWLLAYGLREIDAHYTTEKLGINYIFCLLDEWNSKAEYYDKLYKNFSSPFARAAQIERDWEKSNATLEKQILSPIFGKNFGIAHIYVPLAGFIAKEEKLPKGNTAQIQQDEYKINAHVFDVEDYCIKWVRSATSDKSILVVSGGPGSGKSSFSKIFSAKVAREKIANVIYIPLQHFSISDHLLRSIENYLSLTGSHSITEKEISQYKGNKKILIIFDGLDEITKSGEVAEIVAKSFFSELRTALSSLNINGCRVISIVTGRTPIVQASRDALRARPEMEVRLLKFFNGQNQELKRGDYDEIFDIDDLAQRDLRPLWWKKYQKLNPSESVDMPEVFTHKDVSDLTAEPLLIFLFALSAFHKKEISQKHINRNSVYAELFKGVQERSYESSKRSQNVLSSTEFEEVMQAIATAAWYGDGRTATLDEVKSCCSERTLASLDKAVRGLGMYQLIAAFYFQQAEKSNKYKQSFEFTHKSFGEYLTAKRIFREIKEVSDQLKQKNRFFTVERAVESWTVLTYKHPLTAELLRFIEDELSMHPKAVIAAIQEALAEMLQYSLWNGPKGLPISLPNIHRLEIFSSHSEETLLAILACCARTTENIIDLNWPTTSSAKHTIQRFQSIQAGELFSICNASLSYMNLDYQIFCTTDLSGSNFSGSSMIGADLELSDLRLAMFRNTNLTEARLTGATLDDADFTSAILTNADFSNTRTIEASYNFDISFQTASAVGADFSHSSLIGADFSGADLRNADFSGAELLGANFQGAILEGANFFEAQVNIDAFDQLGRKNPSLRLARRTNEIVPKRFIKTIQYRQL